MQEDLVCYASIYDLCVCISLHYTFMYLRAQSGLDNLVPQVSSCNVMSTTQRSTTWLCVYHLPIAVGLFHPFFLPHAVSIYVACMTCM